MFYLGVNTLLSAFSFLFNYQFIFGLFLLVNLFVGLWASKGVKSIRDYAVGDKNFSTGALTATIVSTWISGNFMLFYLAKVYADGWYFILPFLGDSLALLLIGLWLAPRMGEFLSSLSVADALGKLYGRAVRIITAICGILVSIGGVAIQFKVSAKVLAAVFGFDEFYATLAAAIIVITYSAMGGIRAVTFTDIVQFFTFAAFLPLLALIIWNGLEDPTAGLEAVKTSPQLDFKALLNSPTKLWSSLFLLFFYLIPDLVPTIFQRVSMASHVQQIKRSFLYSFFLCLAITLFTIAIGILLLGQDAHIDPDHIFNFIIETYNYPGMKGLILIGTMAMVMSTADSHINAAAVLFAHDIVETLGWNFKNQVLIARLFAFVVGGLALVLAFYKTEFLELALMVWGFYMPIVSVPLLMTIFGFRSTGRAVLIGMAAGGVTTLLWELYLADTDLNSVIPGMVANLAFLLGSHYLLREEGGWTGIKDPAPLVAARQARREAWRQFINNMKAAKIYDYLQKNLPAREVVYLLFGVYVMGATYALFFTIPQEEVLHYKSLYDFITSSVLFVSAIFIIYPVWSSTFKAKWFITFAWPIGICYILFVVGTMLVMMSDFHQIQVMILLFNLVIAALLLAWPLMVSLASFGVLVGYLVFNTYYESSHLIGVVDSGRFKLIYGTLLFSSLLMALFRFKQNQANLEEKNKYLAESYEKFSEDLSEVLRYREEVLRDLKEDEIQLVDQTAAAYLKQVIYRTVDYLRLDVTKIELEQLLTEVKHLLKLKDFTTPPQIVIEQHTKESTIQADAEKLKQLLVNSISYIHQHNEANKPIIITLDKAMLGHRIDQMEDYTRKLNALKITISTDGAISPTQDIYMLDQINLISKVNEHKDRKQLIENARIIDAHYGYAEFDFYTHMYVIPINVREVRGKVMELLREPTAADPEEINHPMAIQLEQELLNRLKSIKNVNIKVIEKALDTIKTYHAGVKRKSGEPFFTHPINVALILLGYCGDQDALVAALLHDSLEDTSLSLPQVQVRFGKTVAMIVEKLTNLEDRLKRFSLDNHEYIARLTKSEDKRVAYVKLADRLHNMRTIQGHSDVNKQKKIAEETFQLFVPMAEKLGLVDVEKELKELSLEVLSKKG
jgi:Na+/proline symporter